MGRSVYSQVKAQKAFFDSGETKDLSFRIGQLKKLYSAIASHEQDIFDALYSDLRKCETDSYTSEVGLCLREITHAVKNLKSWARPVKAGRCLLFPSAEGSVEYEPYGLSLIISPWNYPFGLAVLPLIASMAAGNCAAVKPSEVSENTSAVLEEVLGGCFDEEYVAVFPGGADVAEELLKERFDYIFFTGGRAVGKIVMRAAAENLTPLTLELGGKNPCIVDSVCDLDKAASRIVWGKYMNAGQTCIAPDYLLAHEDVAERLVEALKERIESFYGKDPKASKDYGRIINRRHFDRVTGYLKGGTILFGGDADPEDLYIAPTLLAGAGEDSPVLSEEIFGPVLPIVRYRETGDAINYVNARPKPLAVYVFSNDRKMQDAIIHRTSSGGVCVNDTIIQAASIDLPFGGVGESGFGRYRGRHGFVAFSNKKSILKNTTLYDTPRYPPYGANRLKIIRRILR